MAESPSQSDAQLVAHQSPGQQADSDLTSLVFEIRIKREFFMFVKSNALMICHLLTVLKTNAIAEMSQQVQMGMENMLKMVYEIDQNSVGIKEEIEKSKDFAMEKKRILEEEKDQFQKAAYTILDMLSNSRG
ncbi:hypothetical protein ISN45_At05g024240 [Arabidopsis thaliana x Arabidopsis arenosa]|uniref:Polyamine-modulated factor 1-binding protein n=2 Tax=Arabidopsis TaxID=3701 RepID=F4JY62_ARATH|nr:polyamine-modulated factor 1-binding protein [Arabidopsis thaliana]AED93468.1 polyamine-modulated factor 1-binding protein [Arabidopsis thaliana]KAG7603463.1 hypothetical protein ISN45_At05g024240 [Arabidopsis thaliana x Arabidopsis arenosa]|eukprot:NP_001190398.1 polyamine-modulated factor 1-binding protein [Arabidopsis thaliana]